MVGLPNGSAEEVYKKLATKRDLVLNREREIAELTIPSLSPPEGYQDGDKLYTPYQDIGSRCINNMASRMVLTMLPPNRAPFRHEVPDALVAEMQKMVATTAAMEGRQIDPTELRKVRSELDLALSKREQAAKNRMETTSLRDVMTQAMKRLLVGGNILYRHQDVDNPQLYGLQQFVTKRNAKGIPLYTILMEKIAFGDLPEDLQAAVEMHWTSGEGEAPEGDRLEAEIEVYSVCMRDGDWWRSWQEVCGKVVKGTEEKAPLNAPPLWPVWMVPMYGRDYGRSYADEYYSGFLAAENYSKVLQEGAIAAGLTLFFTKPGSRTRPRDLKNATNLDARVGSAEDITTLRLEKGADFQFVANQLDAVEKRLGYAFLLNSAIQRNGERVTAEEIRLMAKELDNSMGGVYSSLAFSFQRIIVERFLYLLSRKEKDFPPLPKSAGIKIKIVTGIDALGRSYDDQILDELIGETAQVFGPQAVSERINIGEYFRRKAAAKSIDPDGLVKTDEDVNQERQQAATMSAIQAAAPGVAQEATKGIANGQLQQQAAALTPGQSSAKRA